MKIVTILVGLFILNFLIFIHELGHMLCAKAVKVKILEFYIGFGPKLYSKNINGVDYGIRLIPLGGYVKMDDEQFENESILKQCIILLGGVCFNFILGLMLYWIYAIFIKHYPIVTALTLGTAEVFNICYILLSSFISVFITHPDMGALSGPIGTVNVISDFVSNGIANSIVITILLSMNLTIFNLLPVPALDGGQIIMRLFKLIIRKKETFEKFKTVCSIIGFVCIIGLFGICMWNDILGLIK